MVGEDHTAAPDGPYKSVPAEFFLVAAGGSGIVYVFHTCFPVAASIATRLPRKVQHGYFTFAATISSPPERTPTYTRPPYTLGLPVMPAILWSSILTFHSSSPV